MESRDIHHRQLLRPHLGRGRQVAVGVDGFRGAARGGPPPARGRTPSPGGGTRAGRRGRASPDQEHIKMTPWGGDDTVRTFPTDLLPSPKMGVVTTCE